MTDEWRAALDWAGASLDSPVVSSQPLEGGMTSSMLALTHEDGTETVLRLMTHEPWRAHGAALTSRERDAQRALADTSVPAPASIALDADGTTTGVAGHLMSRLPGLGRESLGDSRLGAMARMLAIIHAITPYEPFRTYETWAWEAKWVVPAWTRHPKSWQRAFDLLAGPAPAHEPTFLHRDFSHRNLLWTDEAITGVVDWVETSTGPAWLDAGHAATTLAVASGPEPATRFLELYADHAPEPVDPYWLVMDAVGFLPPPGRAPLFGSPGQLARLDDWLHRLVG
ncbi:aminoglycoside phosphotransferase family protein [Nocardioides oleivorans]|uniref:Aminoglycoside phosphotransferase family protein n=1 Tax=Nocardioides oleivorans TaxID=273676 RepID=A0A4Q2RY07_9ACTN|nr:aminoglycoside phosphotransferase family protein [Nocardioides oleivorans]RYB92895.1 aminoglycoside phosphotransferase family protein [Nocardioides oleivorans]